jgi:O-6-methylguanine DNA methyltransferase
MGPASTRRREQASGERLGLGRAPVFWDEVRTSLGSLILVATDRGLVRLLLPCEHRGWERPRASSGPDRDAARLAPYAQAIQDFFDRRREDLTVPLDLPGTPFQRTVWHAILRIPYGEVVSYQALAARIGSPSAARAVGRAAGANPVPIVVPCHRVVGAGGALGGYRGGVSLKAALLAFEQGRPLTPQAGTEGSESEGAPNPVGGRHG